jgi:hypothetical protein
VGDVWALQILQFFDVVNMMNIIDGVVLEADVNIKWVSTMSGNAKGNPRMPERGMCRFTIKSLRCQLLEAFVRIAEEKFVKSQICSNMFDATVKLFNENCLPVFVKYDAQIWRENIYWVEKVDDCIKYYKAILENIYKLYSVKKVK